MGRVPLVSAYDEEMSGYVLLNLFDIFAKGAEGV